MKSYCQFCWQIKAAAVTQILTAVDLVRDSL